MGVFEQFPMLSIFVIVVATVLIVSMLRSRQAPRQIECPQCGASPPARARFCNRCGRKL